MKNEELKAFRKGRVEASQQLKKKHISRAEVWWHTPIITALGKQKQEHWEFKVIFSYMASSRLNGLHKTLSPNNSNNKTKIKKKYFKKSQSHFLVA